MVMQWHPLFARLLRPVVEAYFEIQTNVAVGDVPREADLVLLKRSASGQPPFQSIWTALTTWNILEFKSPHVTPRIQDIDLLVELGLGVERRLNDERAKQRTRTVVPPHVSFWYLANRLTSRFLRCCERRLTRLVRVRDGMWRTEVLERPVFLVSNADLPVDDECLPLHIVSKAPHEMELATARFVLERPDRRQLYEEWLFGLHTDVWTEARKMSRTLADEDFEIDFKGFAEHFGIVPILKQFGLKRAIEEVGIKNVLAEVGLDRVIAEVGLDRVIAEVGLDRVIAEVGMDELIARLTPAQRRELKRRLK